MTIGTSEGLRGGSSVDLAAERGQGRSLKGRWKGVSAEPLTRKRGEDWHSGKNTAGG